jgi:hypothetical protein
MGFSNNNNMHYHLKSLTWFHPWDPPTRRASASTKTDYLQLFAPVPTALSVLRELVLKVLENLCCAALSLLTQRKLLPNKMTFVKGMPGSRDSATTTWQEF